MGYVYYLEFADGKKYLGVRTKKEATPDELLVRYFSSSKIVKQKIKKDGMPIKSQILFESSDVYACLDKEKTLLEQNNVKENDDWLNLSISGSLGLKKIHRIMKEYEVSGVLRTDQIRITNGKQDRFISQGTKLPIGFYLGSRSKGTLYYQHKATKEFRRFSIDPGPDWTRLHPNNARIAVNNGIKNKKIKENDLDRFIKDGWVLGKIEKRGLVRYIVDGKPTWVPSDQQGPENGVKESVVKGTVWVFDGTNYRRECKDYQLLLNESFRPPGKGRFWVNNGVIEKMETFVPVGFEKGRL